MIVSCFIPSYLALIFYAWMSGLPLFGFWHWALYATLASLYLLVFTTAGVAMSAGAKDPSDAAVRAVALWFLIVFVIPRSISLGVAFLLPPADAAEFAIQEDEMVSRLRVAHAVEMQRLFGRYMSGAGETPEKAAEFALGRRKALGDLARERRAVVDRLWKEQEQRHQRRQRMIRVLSITPTSTLVRSAAELSWTGEAQRIHFVREARAYDEAVGRRLAERRQAFYARTGEHQSAAFVTHADIRPYLRAFKGTRASSATIFRTFVVDVIMLLCFIFVFAACAVRSMGSVDVRF